MGMMRHGFTLVETLAVIALVAIVTAAVSVSLAGAARAARLDDVADQFVAFDRSTRDVARRFARTPALRFQLNRGFATRTGASAGGPGGDEPVPLVLGGGVRVTRVWLGGRVAGSGEVAVPFSARGQTPSYAVRLAGPAGERWVAFAGLTGQPVVLRDEREVQDILSLASAGTGDASAAGPDAR